MDILKRAKEVIESERNGLELAGAAINDNYLAIIKTIENCQGKVVFTGVGKSGHIGKKLAATFASLGTCAIFVHSTESLHGDLGMVQPEDVVVMMSNSGETQEILAMIEPLKKIGCKKVAFTSKEHSTLAKNCEELLAYQLEREADTLNLAPTTSAVIMLAIGDSIGVTLSEMKQFSSQDFYLYHPGGSLGKKLQTKG
ncbi:arabinose-5-phosphate isomerase [Enterococcus sp. PF1-24]|uniref:KpsF/GutQ family sugar-phosphate isomerase n=1 Tax=unclassified Enterococcus TaxID=2608891 RepID=UPI00247523E8|nr:MULTISPECIES: SIS domain-containing protein [unclassified Enterococcus]MDH6363861.1 arabinose-5-phosphate isomerase [Enterococcus sp. PFB1-1]MDH6400953.1 arabinose-5-phosphate isomerase [Enterococcus sp. PF1-24]